MDSIFKEGFFWKKRVNVKRERERNISIYYIIICLTYTHAASAFNQWWSALDEEYSNISLELIKIQDS